MKPSNQHDDPEKKDFSVFSIFAAPVDFAFALSFDAISLVAAGAAAASGAAAIAGATANPTAGLAPLVVRSLEVMKLCLVKL